MVYNNRQAFHDLKPMLLAGYDNISPSALKSFLASLETLYVDLDPDYRKLGDNDHRGGEISLTQVTIAGRIRDFGMDYWHKQKQLNPAK